MGEEVEKLAAALADWDRYDELPTYAKAIRHAGAVVAAARPLAATLERVERDLEVEKSVVEHWKVLYGSARADTAAAEAQVEAMRKALEEVRDLNPREKPLPADHWEQIRACPECQRYADHPVQRGICNDHRRPMWDQEKYEAHEERALGYRAKGIARDALSALSAPAEERGKGSSGAESAASLASELTDQQRGAPLEAGVQWRLSRFADGEHAKTVYALPPNGSYDPLRRDISALLAAVTVKAEESSVEAAYQGRVHDWMMACFGSGVASDPTERSFRFLEEALELVQANGCTADEAHRLVDYVYGRPVGEIHQEVGGVMVCLAALCTAAGVDLRGAAETELARVWTKVETIRAKHASKPQGVRSSLPGAAPAEARSEQVDGGGQ